MNFDIAFTFAMFMLSVIFGVFMLALPADVPVWAALAVGFGGGIWLANFVDAVDKR